MAGLVVGSYIYAEMSAWLKESGEKWVEMGKVTIPDLVRIPRSTFIVVFATVLTLCLIALQRFTVR